MPRFPKPYQLYRAAVSLLAALAIAIMGPVSRAADPQPYQVTIDKTGNAALDKALNDSSNLVSLLKTAPVGPFALIGRARGDLPRFQTALRSFGYYKGSASITIAGQPLDDPNLPDQLARAPANPPVPVKVSITLGPLFHLRKIDVTGQLPADALAKLGLSPGAPAVASDVLGAQTRLLNALQSEGYALAKVDTPLAVEDPSADALDLTFKVDTGPRVDLGPITLNGLKGVNPSYIRRRLLLHSGEQYNPGAIEAARQDLVSTGLFSIVRAVPADHTDPEGTLPLQFDFTERPIHSVSFGAAYSTDLGVMLNIGWSDRNLFGNGEQLNLTAGFQGGGTAVVSPGYNVNAQFIKPDFLARDQSLQVDLGAVKQDLLSYDQKAVLGDVLLNRKLSPHWSGSVGVAAEQEQITQEGETRDYTLLGLPITLKYDSSNSLLDPTQGIRAVASVTPTQSFGHTEATFLIMQASGSTYLDFNTSGRSVLALRGLIGDAAGASQFELPPDKRFYAGGTATVRGYKYQSLGPEFPDGHPEGGTSVVAGTVEFRQRILSSYGAVAFLDAGQVSANGGPFTGNYGVGVGVGARYYTPIGPIRLDVAVPLVKQSGSGNFQLYIGIGQAF